MPKIVFLGAGSTIFAKRVLGDCMLTPSLRDAHIALYDIDGRRLRESRRIIETLNANINEERARITSHLGPKRLRSALRGADYVINAIQVGGYEPSTVIDFEVPKRYGLRQTIGDTLGIGGIFRALRTAPVMLDFARAMEEVCPEAWMLNYTNPMSMVTGAVLRGSGAKAVGLCHSVQVCAPTLLRDVGLDPADYPRLRTEIAGINHMAWLLRIEHDGKNLYPAIKKKAARVNAAARKAGGEKHGDMVRLEMMRHFGFYVTESSEHNAEYAPYWIKANRPELIEEFHIPLDEYPRRCVQQIEGWKELSKNLLENPDLGHERTHEYASGILDAMETDAPFRIHGNVLNEGRIPNLPAEAVVEIPCLVDRNGVRGCGVGPLPEVCAALNRTNVNVHLLTLEAILEERREAIYHAAMLDPHTASELTLDEIRSLCDEMIEAHGAMLPAYH